MKRLVCNKTAKTKNVVANLFVLIYTLFILSEEICAQALIPGVNSANESAFNMDVPTPTVASLGKYGDTPVSYYTGNPNISIPLYELKARDISMPISLDYDASGVSINNLPGWAGQNWTLNIGGVITRSKRGAIDEKELSDYQTKYGAVLNNYFKNHGKIKEVVTDVTANYQKLKDALTFIGGEWDMSPDIFTFHFLGKSGKFFLGNDGEWKVISDDNLDIIFDYNNNENFSLPLFEKLPSLSVRGSQKKTISGFVIRDAEGNTYHFGYDNNATEYTTNIWRMSKAEHDESWYANSWYLTKIKDKYGNTLLTFSYERGAYIIQMFNYFSYKETTESWSGYSRTDGPNVSSDFPYTLSISSPVYMKRVVGNGITIKLHSSYVPDELATEKLYESFYNYYGISDSKDIYWNNFYKRFLQNRINNFSYEDYSCAGNFFYIQGYGNTQIPSGFNSTVRAEYEQMLRTIKSCRYNRDYSDDIEKMDILRYARIKKLDSLTIIGNGGTIGFLFQHRYVNRRMCLESLIQVGNSQNVIGEYKFRYNKFDKLPSDYLTTAVDYWGHYNGKSYKISDIFNLYIDHSGSFMASSTLIAMTLRPYVVDGSVDPQYASIGVLTEIQYPTGGTTLFEYECGEYDNYMYYDRQKLMTAQNSLKGGSLRIKTIKDYDSPTHDKLLRERRYDYHIPNSTKSSGVLFAYPINSWGFNVKCERPGVSWRTTLFQTTSVVPLSNMFGVSLGYAYVTETDYDFKNDTEQKTVYHYSSLFDEKARDQEALIHFTNEPTPYDNFTEMDFMRGKLLDKKIYDADGHLIHSTEYEYRNDCFLDNNFSYTSNMGVEGSNYTYHFNGGIAKLYYTKYDVVKQTETSYVYHMGSTPVGISTITQYEKQDVSYTSDYPYTHQSNVRLLLSEKLTSGAESQKKEYDYRQLPGGESLPTTSETYKDTDFEKTPDSNGHNFEWYLYCKMFCLKPSVTSFYRNGNLTQRLRNRYTRISNVTSENTLVTNQIIAEYPTGDTAVVADYIKYDATGRPLTLKIPGQPKTYMLWGGTNNNYLLIKSYSPITLSSGSLPMWNETTCLTNILRYIKTGRIATGYVYGPFFQLSKIIDPGKNVTTYQYDDFYRLCGIYDNSGQLIESYRYNYRN